MNRKSRIMRVNKNLWMSFLLIVLVIIIQLVNIVRNTMVMSKKSLYKPNKKDSLKTLENYFGSNSSHVKIWNSITELEWALGFRWPVLIFSTLGRIGNCLTVFGTALALSHLYPNVTVGVDDIVYQKLANILDEKTLSKISVFNSNYFHSKNVAKNFETIQPDYLKGDFHTHVQKEVYSNFHGFPKSPYKISYFEGYTDLFTFKDQMKYVKNKMRLKTDLIAKAKKYLSSIKKKFYAYENITFIGFHIRRGDYINFQKNYFGTKLPEDEFYKKVLHFYREKFETPVFILCSLDRAHMQKKFDGERNVHITENFTPEDDFAILASCNHSAMTVGSFGFWASFLAGGNVIYPRIKIKKHISFTDGVVGIPNFIPIDISN